MSSTHLFNHFLLIFTFSTFNEGDGEQEEYNESDGENDFENDSSS